VIKVNYNVTTNARGFTETATINSGRSRCITSGFTLSKIPTWNYIGLESCYQWPDIV